MNHLPSKPTRAQVARAVRDNEPNAGPGLLALQGNIYQPAARDPNTAIRMRVKTVKSGAWALCRVWDGTQERSGDYRVRLVQGHGVDDEILVTYPGFGVLKDIKDDSSPPRKIVLQEIAGPTFFPVHVTKDGGTYGSSTTTNTATYTVKTLGDKDMPDGASTTATHKTPEWNERIAHVGYTGPSATAICIACYDTAAPPALHLLYVPEKFSGTDCSTPGSGS